MLQYSVECKDVKHANTEALLLTKRVVWYILLYTLLLHTLFHVVSERSHN